MRAYDTNDKKRLVATVLMLLLAVIATVARVALAYKTPVAPNTDADLDDMLLMRYANWLRAGEWVGPYGVHTLAKNPGYAMLMAAFRVLGMRYQLGFALVLVVACVVAARSLRPLVPLLPVRCGLYVLLLYLPAFFTSVFFQRVYRNGAAVVFALVLFSAFVGVYLRRRERVAVLAPWVLLAGLSLGFFSIIQESASWALPFVAVCTLVMLGLTVWEKIRPPKQEAVTVPRLLARLAVLVSPLLIYAGFTAALMAVNNSHYGVFLLNDKYEGEFARATANLMKIDVGYPDDRVWVPNEALDKALEASPTLASIRDEIQVYWKNCQDISMAFGVLDPAMGPQVVGDHSYWALRSAYYEHGGYADAQESERFWGAVASELEDAFAAGALAKKDGLYVSATTQPMPWDVLGRWVLSSVQVLGQFAWGDLVQQTIVSPLPSTELGVGSVDDQLDARDLLGPNTLFAVGGVLYEDQTSQVAQPWLVANNAVGQVVVVAQRTLLCASLVGAAILLVLDVRHRRRDGVRAGLVILGLFLSAFVLVFGATWMISFLSANESAVDAAGNAFAYCGSVYALIGLAECIVLGRLACMCARIG